MEITDIFMLHQVDEIIHFMKIYPVHQTETIYFHLIEILKNCMESISVQKMDIQTLYPIIWPSTLYNKI